ncbi:hypothetical protein DSUL_50245 [Desulfovibrionales bacterium]
MARTILPDLEHGIIELFIPSHGAIYKLDLKQKAAMNSGLLT